jgi:hypothetical protein
MLGPGVPDPPRGAAVVPKSESRYRLAAGALVLAKSVLGALQRRDLLGLSSDGGALEYVYLFTMRDTGHHVHFHGQTLNALCAIVIVLPSDRVLLLR